MGEIMNKKVLSIFLAVLAAALYAINIPFSKLLLENISPTMLASYLYLGAGLGIMIIGTIIVVIDTLTKNHSHTHTHKHKNLEINNK